MEKDFGGWHYLKTNLQGRENGPYFSEREIWLCSVGLNLGHEEDGKGDRFLRPVIIFKKFTSDLFWGIPLTSSGRKGPFHYQFGFKGRTSTAVLSQVRALDRRRLLRRSGIMPEKEFFEMGKNFAKLVPKNETPLGRGVSRGAEAHCASIITEPEYPSNFF